MAKGSDSHLIPFEVTAALRALGEQISRARRARGDTQAVAGERCGLHSQTVARIEQGDPAVSIAKVFTLMTLYDMGARLFELSKSDEATDILMRRHLPKRGAATRTPKGSE
ncbi:helix-turn-helix transcriptional regulator [Hydrogenophaga sp. 2FB]|uniref:helix-turn-helix domain-containing protein n=1 Tax=Hydrogenophaga sp. 2FB TaxID=2502187 RepID=UPI0014852940|nr:helix-turn-helix transcriptional regulator [Hydrogenophaga sp. 2FB]